MHCIAVLDEGIAEKP